MINPHLGTAHGRVEVLGNHTDYNQGLVLAMGVEYATEVSGSNRTDDRLIFKAKDLKESASRLLGVSNLHLIQAHQQTEFLSTLQKEVTRRLGHAIEFFVTRPSGAT